MDGPSEQVGSFRTTVWTVVSRAGRDSRSAVEQIFKHYRPPVVRYLRAHGIDGHTSEDLSQEVFKRLFVDGVLRKADPKLGRFRGLVLAVTRNVLSEEFRRRNALKRREAPLPPPEREDVFDRMWVEHLLDLAVKGLKARSGKGRVPYAEALDLHAREGLSHAAIAARYRCGEGVVRNWVHRARRFIAAEIKRLVREYSSSSQDYETEIRYISRFLG
jgi:RNA polymerase sigma-70 factor (ECF subfamily)